MQFNTHTVTTEQSFHIPDIQIPVEGTIPLPEGIAPIQTVLDIAGTAEVSEVSVCDGKLYLEGVAHFKILYLDAHNEFTGFDAETEFSHLHDLEYTDQLVQTLAWCRLGELNHTVTDGHSVYIQCLGRNAAFLQSFVPRFGPRHTGPFFAAPYRRCDPFQAGLYAYRQNLPFHTGARSSKPACRKTGVIRTWLCHPS